MFAGSAWVRPYFLPGWWSAAYLVLGGFLFSTHSAVQRALVAALMCLFACISWLAASRRYHAIADTPTSRLATAAQGYVELMGRSTVQPGGHTLGFAAIPACVWYHYVVYRQRHSQAGWERVQSQRSDDTFLLVDDTGQCVVDPERAEVLTTHRRTWYSNRYRHRVEYLLPEDRLYALGLLTTEGGAATPLDKRRDVSVRLAAWKRDPGNLLARFDANVNGQIDTEEWERAREVAVQEVDQEHFEIRQQPGVNLLRAPEDGRPYLLSNRDPASLATRYRWWSWLHLCVFLAAGVAGLVWRRQALG
jgi:hypothetical protein